MAIGISPTVDFAFKLLFGSPEHTSVTVHFLNAILGSSIKIIEVQIQNPSVKTGCDSAECVPVQSD